jgi:hypothetical protein
MEENHTANKLTEGALFKGCKLILGLTTAVIWIW